MAPSLANVEELDSCLAKTKNLAHDAPTRVPLAIRALHDRIPTTCACLPAEEFVGCTLVNVMRKDGSHHLERRRANVAPILVCPGTHASQDRVDLILAFKAQELAVSTLANAKSQGGSPLLERWHVNVAKTPVLLIHAVLELTKPTFACQFNPTMLEI